MGKIDPLICLGIPTWGRVTTSWARAYRHLSGPLGSNLMEVEVKSKEIAAARNEIMSKAIGAGAEFLFFLGDDVLPEHDAMVRLLHRMWDNPDLTMATGIYWTKTHPTAPYLWKGLQRGPYLDWTQGEWFQVDYAGCDLLMVRLDDRMKELGPDWFRTDWDWENDGPIGNLNTEDLYFYTKTRDAGLTLWCDSGVQALHEDRETGIMFGLQVDFPQYLDAAPRLPRATVAATETLIADIGCGKDSPYFGDVGEAIVTRFDSDATSKPDYRCDIRDLPVPDKSFDLAYSRHALEHFGRTEAPEVLSEWVRILRVGGKLHLEVPNLLFAMRAIIDIEDDNREAELYPWWQIFGRQDDEADVHRNGFTPRRLEKLLDLHPDLTDISVEVRGEDGINLQATATKKSHTTKLILADVWERIAEREREAPKGLRTADLRRLGDGLTESAALPTALSPQSIGESPAVGPV